ncbi:hypothetical protein ACWDVX_22190 [Streptomyces tendae]
MKTGPCECRHCVAPTPAATPREPQHIDLPPEPTPIRVHTAGRPPFDCVLHPDATLTAVVGGEVRRNFLSFADMRERNWQHAHIELNPGPLTEDAEPETAAEAVQEVLL